MDKTIFERVFDFVNPANKKIDEDSALGPSFRKSRWSHKPRKNSPWRKFSFKNKEKGRMKSDVLSISKAESQRGAKHDLLTGKLRGREEMDNETLTTQ
jgi:hypothetical protein